MWKHLDWSWQLPILAPCFFAHEDLVVQLNVDKLKRQPRQVSIGETVSDFPVLSDLVKQGTVTFDDKITGTLIARWAGDIIEVSGCLKTSVTMPCARCLGPVSRSVSVDVQLCYIHSEDDDTPEVEEVELGSNDLGVIPFNEPEIELRGDIEQEIIMALPQQLLCDESC